MLPGERDVRGGSRLILLPPRLLAVARARAVITACRLKYPPEIPPVWFATISDVQMWEIVRLFEIPPCFATEINKGGLISKNTSDNKL